ncbi:hypothetical protein [Gillisia sp. Hel_I_86]|uniref:hypothetical protein n=1 Tax=Gillisia sp. Hel_I_86 TaxID=1249981 RepID=UPI00119CEE6E|nr:hypothetical protein [Gillisia sp. Hel_I_86]
MKFFGFLFLVLFISTYGMAQEIPAIEESADFIVQRVEIRPSLSTLAPENPYVGKFKIRTVDFDVKDQPIQINLSEIMREEERMRANRYVELAPPIYLTKEKGSVSFSLNPRDTDARYFNQNFNPSLPRTGTRNTVYKDASETTGSIYYSSYSPFYRRYH